MYEADGIDLRKSLYDAMREIERGGRPDSELCHELSQLGLAYFTAKANFETADAWLTRKGRDWLDSYDYSVKKSHRATFREVLLAAWSVIGGAAAGGLATYLLFRWYGIG